WSVKMAIICSFCMAPLELSFLKHIEKEKDKNKERERDAKDKERRTSNGHLFTAIMTVPTIPCHQCNKPINTREAFLCTNCNAQVHKGCRESLPVCAKVKMKVIHCLLYWFSYDCHKRYFSAFHVSC
uniref:Phorbol-ester/DAG-type domain-containing protein n=1 Tax=Cyprinus carpio TaxID=7962 RepID=A0A8C1QH19_CYPCA